MNFPIKMHNHLGQARYKMSLSEQKIFIYAISLIDQNKPNFNEVEFHIRDLAKASGLNETAIYNELEKIIDNIMGTVIKGDRTDKRKGWVRYNLTQRCEHIENEGVIKFKFNEDMKPLLLELKEHYFIQNPVVISFKKWHSIRLYDFLESMSYNRSEYETTIDDLKIILGCEGKYTVWKDFRRYVLIPSIEEINNSASGLDVDFVLLKRGRRAHSITFNFQRTKEKVKNDFQVISKSYDMITLKEKCGLSEENFADGEVLELYNIAVDKTCTAAMDPYVYLRESHAYMTKQLDGVATKSRRYGYLKKVLEEAYINPNQVNLQI